MIEKNQSNIARERRPLITLALITYNQEKYILEAAEGAFSQTYQPLEIILSDDCSTDSTWELLKKISDVYDGPHKIRLNRNVKNLGIGAHVSKVDQMANGELIVHSGGDDISLTNRVSRITEEWLYYSTKPSVIGSNAICIESEGDKGKFLVNSIHGKTFIDGKQNKFHSVLGSSLAVDKNLVNTFCDINSDILAEDVVLYRRAELTISEQVANQCLSLAIGTHLDTYQIEAVMAAVIYVSR